MKMDALDDDDGTGDSLMVSVRRLRNVCGLAVGGVGEKFDDETVWRPARSLPVVAGAGTARAKTMLPLLNTQLASIFPLVGRSEARYPLLRSGV